jgi:hypothetical protein
LTNIFFFKFHLKGSPELTTEVYTPWLTNGKPSVAKAVSTFGDLYVSLKCLSHSNNRGMQNLVNLFVADDLVYRPIITLLEDASSWKGGTIYSLLIDRLID